MDVPVKCLIFSQKSCTCIGRTQCQMQAGKQPVSTLPSPFLAFSAQLKDHRKRSRLANQCTHFSNETLSRSHTHRHASVAECLNEFTLGGETTGDRNFDRMSSKCHHFCSTIQRFNATARSYGLLRANDQNICVEDLSRH